LVVVLSYPEYNPIWNPVDLFLPGLHRILKSILKRADRQGPITYLCSYSDYGRIRTENDECECASKRKAGLPGQRTELASLEDRNGGFFLQFLDCVRVCVCVCLADVYVCAQ
jgi:hypothetical protein